MVGTSRMDGFAILSTRATPQACRSIRNVRFCADRPNADSSQTRARWPSLARLPRRLPNGFMTPQTDVATRPRHAPSLKGPYRFFPGWIMLVIAAAALFMSAPGQSYSVAAFKDPMRIALGVSETQYSFAYGIATIVSGISLPFVGRMLDAFGARRMLPVLAVFLGAACLLMSRVSSLTGLFFGFSMIRCLGQGALTLISTWIVGEWFEKKRGLATALCGLGGSVSVMSFPLLNSYLITNHGWQVSWQVLGVIVWGVLVLPALFLLKDRPEDLGLHPDGAMEESSASETLTPSSTSEPSPSESSANLMSGSYRTHESWTVREVLRDLTFWKLLSVPATGGMIGTGLIFHQVALMGARGVESGWALSLISLQATVATLAAVGAGWLTDRVQSRYLMSASMIFLAIAILILLIMPHPLVAILYAALLGLHGSIQRSTGTVVWINYYGRTHQGAVRGAAYSAMVLASALGPLPLAYSYDSLGSWNPALICFIAIPVASAILVWTAYPPRRTTS